MKDKKRKAWLPIGRIALFALQMDTLRKQCCEAAETIMKQRPIDEAELEECARLDDALADAQRVLRNSVARAALSRLRRRIRKNSQ